jgi:hypothetical protein
MIHLKKIKFDHSFNIIFVKPKLICDTSNRTSAILLILAAAIAIILLLPIIVKAMKSYLANKGSNPSLCSYNKNFLARPMYTDSDLFQRTDISTQPLGPTNYTGSYTTLFYDVVVIR